MNVDDRLRHAFTDLEIRVNTTVTTRPRPTGAPAPKPPNRFLRVAVVAAIAIAAIGVAALLQGPGDNDVAGQPATTVPAETTVPAQSTTPATEGTVDPGKGVATTAVTGAPATTTTVATETTTAIPIAPGLVTVSFGGVVERYLGDENLTASMLDRPATIAFTLNDGTLVYQDASDSSLHVLSPAGQDTVLVQQAAGDRLRLLNVIDYGGATRAAYTVRRAIEATTETLFLATVTDPTDVATFEDVGGGETGVSAVSAAGGLLLIEHTGEGLVWYSVYDAGAPTTLPVAPSEPCPVLLPSTCGWHMHLLTDGTGVAVVESDGTDSAVVIRDLAGVELARAELPGIAVADIDVAGPRIAVTTWSATDGEPNPGDVYVVMYTAGEATLFETPMIGYATADRT